MLLVGRVSGFFGVQGWLKIFSYTRPKNNITHYNRWQLKCQNSKQSFLVEQVRPQQKTIVAKLQSIDDLAQAKQWLNADIFIDTALLTKTSAGEYYWYQLQGLTVINQQGKTLGVVAYLLETGANDVLVVKNDKKEILIPFIETVVGQVCLTKQVIDVDWDDDFN